LSRNIIFEFFVLLRVALLLDSSKFRAVFIIEDLSSMSSVNKFVEEMAFSKNVSEVIPLPAIVNQDFERRVESIRDHSKNSIILINECFHDVPVQCKEELSFCVNNSDSNLHLDYTIKKAAESSLQFELFKEKELKNNCNSLIRSIDPFGEIPHIEHIHGHCRTLPGGSMHAIFQFFISIEKVTLLPVTLTNLSFKLLLDSYGQMCIDLSDFENEMRGIRILQAMSSNKLGSLPSPRETLFQDFNDLLVFKIGVPPFFQFSLKQSIFCSSCNERFKQCKIFRKYIVKVKCNYLSQDTSITELLR